MNQLRYSTSSCNGLVKSVNMPLLEPELTMISVTTWHHFCHNELEFTFWLEVRTHVYGPHLRVGNVWTISYSSSTISLPLGWCGCSTKLVVFNSCQEYLFGIVSVKLFMGCSIKPMLTNQIRYSTGSHTGLVPSSNKPLPEPELSQFCVTTWHH